MSQTHSKITDSHELNRQHLGHITVYKKDPKFTQQTTVTIEVTISTFYRLKNIIDFFTIYGHTNINFQTLQAAYSGKDLPYFPPIFKGFYFLLKQGKTYRN